MIDPVWYELRDAVQSRQFDKAAALLITKPSLVSLKNSLGETVLHYLAVENDGAGVAWLGEHGFDLDSKNDFGIPMIFEVAQLGYKELLLWFKQAGADFQALDGDGQSIIAYLQQFDTQDVGEIIDFVHGLLIPGD